MNSICVITGGGSGMGYEAAKLLGKQHKIILVGRTVEKLESAIEALKAEGIDAEAYPGDASDRESISALAKYAASLGEVKAVLHAAGVSPHMTDAEKIFTINAVGTINVNEEFGEVMKGGCILNVASMAGYMLPLEQVPTQLYEASAAGVEAFLGGAKQMLGMVPEEKQTGAAYTISKNFVQWYSRREAVKLGKKGIRVVSISPGTFSTPMGELEGEQANKLALMGALGRVGDPVEIAKMMNFILSDNCSYMTGVDVLYDGGVIAALEVTKAQQAPQE